MLTEEGNIELIDFGFAKIILGDRTYTNCGTLAYAAPEVLSG